MRFTITIVDNRGRARVVDTGVQRAILGTVVKRWNNRVSHRATVQIAPNN